MKKRVLFQIIFVALLIILSISCNYLSQPEENPDNINIIPKITDQCFFFNNNLLTYEEDGKVLYSPIIKIHYSGKWTKYQLAQLDSIYDFVKRNDSCLFDIEILFFKPRQWGDDDPSLFGTEKAIKKNLEKKIKKKKLHFLTVSIVREIPPEKHISIPELNYCIMDSIQKKDSIYFLLLTKKQCFDCKCHFKNYYKKYGPKGNRKTY